MTWPRVPLRELGTWYGGGTPSKSNSEFWTDGTVPWLSPRDMGSDNVTSTRLLITHAAVVGSPVRMVPAGSVAVVVRSGVLERTIPIAVVPFETTLNQDMKALAPRPDVDARWVAYGLRAFEHALLRGTRKAGTTVASIEVPRLLAFELPVPPLHEQRRIVEILEDHLSRLGAAESTLQRCAEVVGVLNRAGLQKGLRGSLVPDDLSEGSGHDLVGEAELIDVIGVDKGDTTWPAPQSWAWVRLGELFNVSVGSTPSRADASLWRGDLPWVSSGEVAFNRIHSTRERITRSAAGNAATRIHPPGTVMLAMIGEGRTRGQAAILDIEAAHNQNCASIRVGETSVLPEYVYAFLKERYLETRRAGAGGNQPALNKGTIRCIPIPIPPLATQRRLVAAFERADLAQERLSSSIARVRLQSRALRSGLLAAAFSGKLSTLVANGEDTEVTEDA